jgi:hypothetical protein
LTHALDQLADAELSGRVGPELIELERLRARLDAQISRRIEAFDRTLEHTLTGHRTTAAWLNHHCHTTSIDAHTRVRVARQLRDCEPTRTAWKAGRISARHVEVLTRTRHAAKAPTEFAELEPVALPVAETASPETLARLCTRWREALDTHRADDDPTNEAEQRFERRGLHASATLHDMVAVDGVLDPATGEVVLTALDLAMDHARVPDDPRTLPQLRADALGQICEHYRSHRQPGTNKPHIVIHTDTATLTGTGIGQCRTERGTHLDPITLQHWACDAIVHQLITDGPIPLALGRATRTFTPAQLRAMAARDHGCRWPGCTQPPTRCQAHHLQWWERDHGPTDLDNGALFCNHHHRQLHTGRFAIEPVHDPDHPHAFDIIGPDDAPIGRSQPPPPPSPPSSPATANASSPASTPTPTPTPASGRASGRPNAGSPPTIIE